MNTPTIAIHRAQERLETKLSWLAGRHSFSFGSFYDPTNVGHGLLLVNNDDVIAPGTGFDTHPHQDMEIVTWLLEGELEHKDSEGNRGLLYPGLAQRMSACRLVGNNQEIVPQKITTPKGEKVKM